MCADSQQAPDAVERRHQQQLAALGALTSSIAHELGTPLNVISGRVDLMRTELESNECIEEHMRVIREQCRHMKGIIRQVLDFSRKPNLVFSSLDATQLVDEVYNQFAALFADRGIALHCTGSASAPVHLCGDRGQIQQVLTNLLMNALQATPRGGKVEVGVGPGKGRRFTQLHVTDTGEGIPPAKLGRIFQPFYSTKGTGGTGLGLFLCHQIVAQHGGHMEVQSELGEGTRIDVFLPKARPHAYRPVAAGG